MLHGLFRFGFFGSGPCPFRKVYSAKIAIFRSKFANVTAGPSGYGSVSLLAGGQQSMDRIEQAFIVAAMTGFWVLLVAATALVLL